MSELSKDREIEPAVELIVHGLSEWLKKEVGSSTAGRNHYLDDFNGFRHDITQSYDVQRNDNAQKNRSHYSRLIQFTSELQHYDVLTTEQQDYVLARQIFCAQMYLSGLFRVQCLMQASDQEDYYERRLDRSFIGIDLGTTIKDKWGNSTTLAIDELAKKTLNTNQNQQEHVKRLHEIGYLDAGQARSPTIDKIMHMQKEWVDLVVDYVLFAADERDGDLAAVPFLEPKSISDDPQIYYPFVNAT